MRVTLNQHITSFNLFNKPKNKNGALISVDAELKPLTVHAKFRKNAISSLFV